MSLLFDIIIVALATFVQGILGLVMLFTIADAKNWGDNTLYIGTGFAAFLFCVVLVVELVFFGVIS